MARKGTLADWRWQADGKGGPRVGLAGAGRLGPITRVRESVGRKATYPKGVSISLKQSELKRRWKNPQRRGSPLGVARNGLRKTSFIFHTPSEIKSGNSRTRQKKWKIWRGKLNLHTQTYALLNRLRHIAKKSLSEAILKQHHWDRQIPPYSIHQNVSLPRSLGGEKLKLELSG